MNDNALFTMEEISKKKVGTYKLYKGRSADAHGAWICTLSEFDRDGDETRQIILDALNRYSSPEGWEPKECPTCGSDDKRARKLLAPPGMPHAGQVCPDPWHDEPKAPTLGEVKDDSFRDFLDDCRAGKIPGGCPKAEPKAPTHEEIKTYSANDTVYFKLTQTGHEILNEYAENFHREHPQVDITVKWKPYNGEWYKEQFWSLLERFGDKSYIGRILPISDITFDNPCRQSADIPPEANDVK